MFDWLRRREAKKMSAKYVGAIIRTLLAAVGGAGIMSEGDTEQLAGAVVTLATGLWSLWQKRQAEREKQQVEADAKVGGGFR